MRKLLLFTLVLLLTTTFSFSQQLETDIDSLLANVFKDKNGPGGVFLVAKAGKTIYKKAFGKANLELNVDLTTEDVFQIGSMTKQFTAVAILQLAEQGKLELAKKVSDFIPDYPGGDKITIHHLLTHTSGIKDFTKLKILRDIAQKDVTPQELVNLFKNEPVDFAPGKKFDYNNSGYALLGYIVELASGQSYENYIRKNIFDKVGMSQSRYASDTDIILHRAYGYRKNDQGYINKNRINFSLPYASGSLMSTVEDMLKWQNALNQHLLLNKESSRKAFTAYALNNGEKITYGYGWHIKDINGEPSREHGGSIFGFKSMAVYIPGKDVYVVGFSNCDCNSPTQVTKDIAALALRSKL